MVCRQTKCLDARADRVSTLRPRGDTFKIPQWRGTRGRNEGGGKVALRPFARSGAPIRERDLQQGQSCDGSVGRRKEIDVPLETVRLEFRLETVGECQVGGLVTVRVNI